MQLNTLIEILIQMKISIVAMWGMGHDSFNGIQRLIKRLKHHEFPLERLVILTSQTGLEWSYTGYLNELFLMPYLAKENIRLIQIIKAGPAVRDRYTVLDDSRSPRKLWLYGRSTPPLSPMSENIPYDVEPLSSPLHPLWNPDAIWDLDYRPENFGPVDSYMDLDYLPTRLSANNTFHVRRSHRHHVCRLPADYPALASQQSVFNPIEQASSINQILQQVSINEYYLLNGTLPQFRNTRRECSEKFKANNNEAVVVDIVAPKTWSLGQNLLSVGGLPQFAADGRICSNQYKQECAKQAIEDKVTVHREHSLGKDLLQGGVVPQARSGEGRGKCSAKAKQVTCNTWVDEASLTTISSKQVFDQVTLSNKELLHSGIASEPTEWRSVGSGKDKVRLEFNVHDPNKAVSLPPYVVVCIFFNADEKYRRDRAEFAIAKKREERKQPVKPKVYRIDVYPLIEEGITRSQLEQENRETCGEPHMRSACSVCCFAGICGTDEEVLEKHRNMPIESGLPMVMEFIARILNSKQTLFPGSRGLIEMNMADGNWEALMNFQARLEALQWSIYRVQRLTGGTPYRRTQILATGDCQAMQEQFEDVCRKHNAYLACDTCDGMTRGWIEYRDYTTETVKRGKAVTVTHTVQDLIVLCPAVPVEKHRSGWYKAWTAAHTEQLTI